MVDMLVEPNSRGPLTPVSSPGGSSDQHHHHHHHHHHPDELSPSSSSSSSSSSHSSSATTSDSQSPPSHSSVVIKEEPGDVGALQRLQFALEKNTLFSNLYGSNKDSSDQDLNLTKMPLGTPTDSEEEREDLLSTSNSEAGGAANIFECPLCSVTCNSRHEFNEHLVSHSQQHACPKCSFITNDEEALRGHLQEEHDIRSPDFSPDDDVSSPRINSQGKVKTFKCKQCEFKTDTKLKFWEHTKSHIRQEKMLTCPKCPFVTEYKHHLEYHLRNHFGSKPFQCTKCSYSCVNKSMLNSHLKSHSNVYQYRCADCSYATKYCHSLKLHLRKYSHSPSVVLNLDGTPNPLPIIDVYGTRRGPKIKRSDPSATSPSLPTSNTTTHVKSELKKRVAKSSATTQPSQPPPKSVSPPARKFTPPAAATVSETDSHYYHRMPDTPITPGKNPLEMYAAVLNQYILASNPLLQMVPDLAKLAKEQQSQLLSHLLTSSMIPQTTPSPPLLGSNSPPPSFLGSGAYNTMASEPTVLDLRKPINLPETPPREDRRGAGTKRKGKAIKYEDNEILDFSNNNNKRRLERCQQQAEEEEEQIKMCKYCEISFPDRVLYKMHMSYHSGDSEPFLCKSCGKRNQDKVTFFLHLTTEAH